LERLGDCTALKTLDLYGCQHLTPLPARLADCAALKTLDLSGCSSALRDSAVVGRLEARGCKGHLNFFDVQPRVHRDLDSNARRRKRLRTIRACFGGVAFV
jgi:hypothetical protein